VSIVRKLVQLASVSGVVLAAGVAFAAPTRSSPVAVGPDGAVFVVNPDQGSVARIVYDDVAAGTLTHESSVGRYPRTLAVAGSWVYTADQDGDGVSRRDQVDLGNLQQVALGPGCNPFGIAPTPAGDELLVTCQGSSEVVFLSPDLAVRARVKLDWPGARAIAIGDDGRAFVTHYLTEEPGVDAHVSVLDVTARAVTTVWSIPPDLTTCETQNSGQGVLNLLNTIAIVPAGPQAGQVWVGGTQENTISKGLFKRYTPFLEEPGHDMFPGVDFLPRPMAETAASTRRGKRKNKSTLPPFPNSAAARNKYKASFHDITRFGIVKLDGATGAVVGKIDVDEANHATDLEFSADGGVAYVVDQMFHSYHVFNTARGQGGDPTTLFAGVAANGPGGADPSARCIPDALNQIRTEGPYRMAPQAQITPIDGFDPVRIGDYARVDTGVDFDAATYMSTSPPIEQMRPVPDAIGTAPIGVRLSADGTRAYVANYLARNVVVAATAQPTGGDGKPSQLRCAAQIELSCGTNNDCPAGAGVCNHPGGPACSDDADCGDNGPCIRSQSCVPLILGDPVGTLAGGLASDALPPAILDGKILFNTAARDSSTPNNIGLGAAAPLFNDPAKTNRLPGSVVSTSHDASYVTCSTCHADYGGQDGRSWDFSQFGASLRNSMDLRGRSAFAPGTCSNDPATTCFFDAACGAGNFCRAQPHMIPPNVPEADRERWFNPMLTVHWNGDRDEVEDFEFTYRSLLGAGDCDGFEDIGTGDVATGCMGALVQRNSLTSTDPVDVNPDLGAPNRNLRGKIDPSKIVGIRLSHMADFVYSLTEFPRNPNQPDEAAERGRRIFNDPQTRCAQCHASNQGVGREFFTDKRPSTSFDPSQPGRADRNNPFLRHDVGTANLFDKTDPHAVAMHTQSFHNERTPQPAPRDVLGEYVTPMLNDVWNTAPYLHDGSAPTLLDVIRPCDTTLDDCLTPGRGRNLDEKHGGTAFLTPQQLNDLARFQETLSTDTVVGQGDRVVHAGRLRMARLQVATNKKGASAVAIFGQLTDVPGAIDPAAGLLLSLATPDGKRMRIVERRVTMRPQRGGFVGQATENGRLKIKLKPSRNGWTLGIAGRKLDLAALGLGEPDGTVRRRDLTVALEIASATGGPPATFAQSRVVEGKKRTLALAKPRRTGRRG
jgi:DNA-binding beta-propeller fold protein YncE